MDLTQFRASLEAATPPAGLSPVLQALWYDAKGDWHTAHTSIQSHDTRDGARVHAYLHRKEGDLANANYWYRRAGQPSVTESLEREWEMLVNDFLRAS